MARGPLQRRFEIRNIDHSKSGEKLLCFRIRAIMYMPLSVAHRDGGRRLGRNQSRPADKDSGSLKRLGVGFSRSRGSRLIAAIEMFLGLVNEHDVFHGE